MNSGTDTRRLFGMRSSEVFSFDLEGMPDKTAGQGQFSALFEVPYFIGKTGS
jgi:hypothetical protein